MSHLRLPFVPEHSQPPIPFTPSTSTRQLPGSSSQGGQQPPSTHLPVAHMLSHSQLCRDSQPTGLRPSMSRKPPQLRERSQPGFPPGPKAPSPPAHGSDGPPCSAGLTSIRGLTQASEGREGFTRGNRIPLCLLSHFL